MPTCFEISETYQHGPAAVLRLFEEALSTRAIYGPPDPDTQQRTIDSPVWRRAWKSTPQYIVIVHLLLAALEATASLAKTRGRRCLLHSITAVSLRVPAESL